VVELPLGATEDRVCGTIDIAQALGSGVKCFEAGLLARANRGFLYIDEVNLLEDHLVDLLLDVAVTGVNKVERESISVEHPARFVLVGSGNPEEGELRPQLLDRFGLVVEVKTEDELDRRMEIVERRIAFERDREAFCRTFADEQEQLRKKIARARSNLVKVKLARQVLKNIAQLCSDLKVDGHRGELTITRAARALAAFEGRRQVTDTDVKRVAVMSLRHRLRRDALEEAGSTERIEKGLESIFEKAHRAGGKNGADFGEGEGKRFSPDAARGKRMESSQPLVQSGGQSVSPNGNPGTEVRDQPPLAPLVEKNSKLKFDRQVARESSRKTRFQSSRQTSLTKAVYDRERGRYARSVSSPDSSRKGSSQVALDATLRSLLSSAFQPSSSELSPAPLHGRRRLTPVSSDALRFKLFKRKQGRLFIFAIDLSGSMALNRIAQAKGMMLALLRQSYIKRDSVAIVAFRGTSADILLPPSRSILRARRVLGSLGIGGGTPLSAGLACAVKVAQRAAARSSGEIALLLFTDGHANVPLQANGMKDRAGRRRLIEDEVKRLGSEMRKAGIDPVVVDTQNAFTPNGDALALAENLGARYFQVRRSHELSAVDSLCAQT
jgi:magnesium chelatase subunit D